jgi:NADPH-dependent curcumin reductase CurA
MRVPDSATWAPPFTPSQPLINGAVSKVLRSSTPDIQTGVSYGICSVRRNTSVVIPAMLPMVLKLENPLSLDLALFTGALGTSGLSA